jgi:signal transduction histidine kinase
MKINFCLLFFISFGFTNSQEIDVSYVDSLKQESRKKFKRENPEVTFKILNELKEYSIKNNYHRGLFDIANDKGIFYYFMGELDSTRAYYNKAIKIGEKYKLYRALTNLQSNFGVLEEHDGNYNEAIKWYLESIKLVELYSKDEKYITVSKDSMQIGKNYHNISGVYEKMDDSELYEFYIKKSIEFIPEKTQMKGVSYIDLATLRLKKNEYSEVVNNLKKAKKVNEFIKDDLLSFYIDNLYGDYYFKLKQFKVALDYYIKANSSLDNQSFNHVIENDISIGICYHKLKDLKNAEKYLNKAIDRSNKKKPSLEVELKMYTNLATIKNDRKPTETFNLLKNVISIKDSINKTEKIKLSKKLSIEFETEKKDKELAENALEIEKKKSQLWSTIGIAVFLLALCLVLFLVYKLNKQKHNVKILSLEKENELSKLEALLQGEDKERSRVAKDLHDGINGDLSAIKIQLSGLSTDNFSNKEAQIFDQSIGMIDNACEVIRSISHNLAPPAIKDFGWLEAVEKFCYKMNKNYKEEIIFQSYGNNVQFSETTQGHLYRITQELVYNTLKHAKASEVLVQINLNDTSLVLTIEDDGVGFDKTKNYEGIGLKNIESRVAYLDGKWKLEVDKNGTSNNLEFNINKLL